MITGPKHCGKSSVAFALRNSVKCRSGDLDSIIEKRTGKTPRELYLEGIEVFKREEAEKLEFVLQKENINQKSMPLVLATGGGIIDNPDAIKLIINYPDIFIVYLDVSAETAWQRINKSRTGLPAYLTNSPNPKAGHCAIHEARAARYKDISHLVIETENKTATEIANEIIVQTGINLKH